jgi:hypothetical protein
MLQTKAQRTLITRQTQQELNSLQQQQETDATIAKLKEQTESLQSVLDSRTAELAETVDQAIGVSASHKQTLDTLTRVSRRRFNMFCMHNDGQDESAQLAGND